MIPQTEEELVELCLSLSLEDFVFNTSINEGKFFSVWRYKYKDSKIGTIILRLPEKRTINDVLEAYDFLDGSPSEDKIRKHLFSIMES